MNMKTANNRPREAAPHLAVIGEGGRRKTLFGLNVILLMCICLMAGTPAFAIRLIPVKHLFDVAQNFDAPSEVSVAKDGRIYVVDGVNHQVKVFDDQGAYAFAFGGRGDADGRFNSPLGIHIDRSGKVYVADSGNHRVQIFDPDGSFIDKIAISSDASHLADPTDVVVDSDAARCFVVDNDNHRIRVFDLATKNPIGNFGRPGAEKREFRYPFLIDIGKENDLYIVDVINTRVQVLNPEGLFVNFIGEWGVEKGEFFRPKGIAVDRHERVFVSDSYLGVVQVFESTGELYAVVGEGLPATVKKFRTPVGLFVDGRDRLYVTEMLANKVSVYQMEGVVGQN